MRGLQAMLTGWSSSSGVLRCYWSHMRHPQTHALCAAAAAYPYRHPDPARRLRQGRLLETLPRELREYLMVSAVVRSAAAELGGTVYDRLRISAVYALRVRRLSLQSAAHLLCSWLCQAGDHAPTLLRPLVMLLLGPLSPGRLCSVWHS